MSIYYNQFSIRPAAGSGTPNPRDSEPVRPLRTQEQAAAFLDRRYRQRRQRIRAY